MDIRGGMFQTFLAYLCDQLLVFYWSIGWFFQSIYSTKTNIDPAVTKYHLLLTFTQKADKSFYAWKRTSNGSISFPMVNKKSVAQLYSRKIYIQINLSLCFENFFCSWSHLKFSLRFSQTSTVNTRHCFNVDTPS